MVAETLEAVPAPDGDLLDELGQLLLDVAGVFAEVAVGTQWVALQDPQRRDGPPQELHLRLQAGVDFAAAVDSDAVLGNAVEVVAEGGSGARRARAGEAHVREGPTAVESVQFGQQLLHEIVHLGHQPVRLLTNGPQSSPGLHLRGYLLLQGLPSQPVPFLSRQKPVLHRLRHRHRTSRIEILYFIRSCKSGPTKKDMWGEEE